MCPVRIVTYVSGRSSITHRHGEHMKCPEAVSHFHDRWVCGLFQSSPKESPKLLATVRMPGWKHTAQLSVLDAVAGRLRCRWRETRKRSPLGGKSSRSAQIADPSPLKCLSKSRATTSRRVTSCLLAPKPPQRCRDDVCKVCCMLAVIVIAISLERSTNCWMSRIQGKLYRIVSAKLSTRSATSETSRLIRLTIRPHSRSLMSSLMKPSGALK